MTESPLCHPLFVQKHPELPPLVLEYLWLASNRGFNSLPPQHEPERFVMPWQEVPKTRALRASSTETP